MRASDLDRLELIGIDRSRGFPLFGDYRMVMFGMPSLSRLGKDLIESLGFEKAMVILSRFGYETGLGMATTLSALYDFDSAEERLRAGAVLRNMAGLADEELTSVSLDPANKTLNMTGRWRDSFESVNWLSRFPPHTDPVCHILAGISSGYASAVLGCEVMVREIACRAQGHDDCRFEGRPLADWGIRPEDIHRKLDIDPLEQELARLQAALNQAREDLGRKNVEISRLRMLTRQVQTEGGDIIFRSPDMSRVLTLARKVAPTRSSVLIQGESGVGKEVMARFIHRHANHAEAPFLAINCAALPPGLLESELFGHVKGAFTGADSDKKGLFVEAGEGTLFLDEVAELSPELQAKLLRAIQEKEVRPVGGTSVHTVHARIISAANRDLREMMVQGKFREDLYYRLAVFPLFISPLRERRQDILILARHFLFKLNPESCGFSPAALRYMESYSWPGNVRELSNWVEYAVILAGSELIQPEHLPRHTSGQPSDPLSFPGSDQPTLAELEKRYIGKVLEKCGNRRGEAAKLLGISTATLWRRLQEKR